MRTQLGKITKIKFGYGGYQDAMIGVSFTLGNDGWGVNDFWGGWGIERNKYVKWTEEDRIKQLGEMTMKIKNLLDDAKKTNLDQLEGIPVEVTFDGIQLKEWRILKEVI